MLFELDEVQQIEDVTENRFILVALNFRRFNSLIQMTCQLIQVNLKLLLKQVKHKLVLN